jgi:hypothetical protein
LAYELDLPTGSRIQLVIHVSRLRAFHAYTTLSHTSTIPPDFERDPIEREEEAPKDLQEEIRENQSPVSHQDKISKAEDGLSQNSEELSEEKEESGEKRVGSTQQKGKKLDSPLDTEVKTREDPPTQMTAHTGQFLPATCPTKTPRNLSLAYTVTHTETSKTLSPPSDFSNLINCQNKSLRPFHQTPS